MKIVPPNFGLCRSCFFKEVLSEKEIYKLNYLAKILTKKVSFIATKYLEKRQLGYIKVNNLEEVYPEHSGYSVIRSGPLLKAIQHIDKFPMEIRDEELIFKHLSSLLKREFYNAKFETYMSKTYNSNFITAKSSDKMIIDTVSENDVKTKNKIAPIYDMPIIEGKDLNDILYLRDREQSAFNQYRMAIQKAIKSYKCDHDEVDIKQIFDNEVHPAFTNLDIALKRASQENAKKMLGELVISASTVTIGILGGLIPSTTEGILSGIGCALVPNLGRAVVGAIAQNKLPENDYYFLWKLRKG